MTSLWTSDFESYKEALAQLVPWFFALDHVHYSRWLSIHVRDMTTLSQRCPDVYDHFMLCAFTSNVTGNRFSSIELDQAHKHLNAQVKGDGGAIGLTEKPGALRRWMVAGPQLSTIIAEFEERLPLCGSTPVQSFKLASQTERFWCLAALLYIFASSISSTDSTWAQRRNISATAFK